MAPSRTHCTEYRDSETCTKAHTTLRIKEIYNQNVLSRSQNKDQVYLQCEVERLEKALIVFQLNKVGGFHRIAIEKRSREDFSERSRQI